MSTQKKIVGTKKRIRKNLDLEPEDAALFNELVGTGNTRVEAVLMRKALRLLASLKRGEVFLTTSTGEKIPNSIIFS
jgi:hypothetical protein